MIARLTNIFGINVTSLMKTNLTLKPHKLDQSYFIEYPQPWTRDIIRHKVNGLGRARERYLKDANEREIWRERSE